MKAIRIKPISAGMVSIHIDCECGGAVMSRNDTGVGEQFSHSVQTSDIVSHSSFELHCKCKRIYAVKVQIGHFHVTEIVKKPNRPIQMPEGKKLKKA